MNYYYPFCHCQFLAVIFDSVAKRRIFGNLCKAKDGIEGFRVEVMKSDLMAVSLKRLNRSLCYGVIEASWTRVGEDY
jgi:hypothetical protein